MAVYYFHQARQVEKESGAEGEKDIGQLWTILQVYNQCHTSYGLKNTFKLMYNFISYHVHGNYLLVLYSVEIYYSKIFNNSYILPSLKYITSANYDMLASYTYCNS